MPFTKEEALSYFENKAAETWESIKQNFNNQAGGEEKYTGLFDYRDVIDYKLYREAVEKIFPNYNLTIQLDGHMAQDRFGREYF